MNNDNHHSHHTIGSFPPTTHVDTSLASALATSERESFTSTSSTQHPSHSSVSSNPSTTTNTSTSSAENSVSSARLSLWQTEPSQPPKIFHAVWNHQWDYARFLLSNSNATASLSHSDSYGYTPLHFACWEGAPTSLLNEMLYKYPISASKRNNKGRTPLHFACWRGTDECVNRLLKHRPDAASVRDKNEKSPLYDACIRNRSYDVLRALLLADIKQSGVRSIWGVTPATVLAKITHACTLEGGGVLKKKKKKNSLLMLASSGTADDKEEQHQNAEHVYQDVEEEEDYEEKEYQIWDILSRVSLLLHAELYGSFPLPPPPPPNKNIPPLSIDTALRSASCPHALLLVALEYDLRCNSSLSQLHLPTTATSTSSTTSDSCCCSSTKKTEESDYLLHTAAKLTHKDFPYHLFYKCDKCGYVPFRFDYPKKKKIGGGGGEEEEKRKVYFNKDPYMSHYGVTCSKCMMEALRCHYLEVEPVDKIAKAVDLLVSSFPSAASFPDSNGRLPINLYIESGKHYDAGLVRLFRASTRTIETRDVCTHMYPFMLAAASREGGREKKEDEKDCAVVKKAVGVAVGNHQHHQQHQHKNNEQQRQHWLLNLRQKAAGGTCGRPTNTSTSTYESLNLKQGEASSSTPSTATAAAVAPMEASEWRRKSTIVFNLILKDPTLLQMGLS